MYDGNHLLHFLMGAEIKVVRPEDESRVYEQTMERLKGNGLRPYWLKDTGSTPPGVAGYINAVLEILQQSVELGVDFNYLIHTTGSGGTQAGLVIGTKAFNTSMKIIGSTTGSRTKEEATEKVIGIIEEALKLLNLNLKIESEDVHIYDKYAGGGYGNISVEKAEAIKLVAESEGIILDPVYTASFMACLIDLCRQGFFKPTDSVVFLHTGGAAVLSSYGLPLKAYGHRQDMPWSVPPWSPQAR
jgi:1-aminocyclopropane-1-carboxylate deaminase/D-cysteine desulfhydrase-like pyridoxal-dependent ACC family enzyme